MPRDGSRPRATSYDVARAAGVSQSTVSRCFQNEPTISAATRARVLAAAERLGYMPNALARSLITQKSDLIGVIVTRYTLHGNPDVTFALGESLGDAGKQLLLFAAQDDRPGPGFLRRVLEYPLGGLICCVLLGPAEIGDLRRRGVPVVFYNRDVASGRADMVTADHESASAALASRLLDAGHRQFLCIGGPPLAPVSEWRLAGFRAALGDRGLTPVATLHSDYSYAGGRNVFLAHAGRGRPPDAVLCANDQIAMGVMDACRFELGRAVPADISVTGFDDVAEAGRPTYELTTVHQASLEMAREAVRLLLARLAEPGAAPRRVVVPAHVVIRGSARL